jgi:hypothetical protein
MATQRQAERMLGDYQRRMAAAGRTSTIVSVTVEPNEHRRLFALITCVAVPSLSALAAAITAAVLR